MLIDEKQYKNILLATWLGWIFDGFDSSLYPLVANQALSELIGKNNSNFGQIASIILAIFLIGWALGGFIFGYLGDRIGRVKSLSFSILIYALFTGFSGLAYSWIDLSIFRFFSGIGIGGEWALGVALLSESVNSKKRIMSTALLATGFQLGYILALVVNFLFFPFGWRLIFFIGIIPALLVFFIRKNIKEPTVWSSIKEKNTNVLEIFKKEYSYKLWTSFLLGTTLSVGVWGCLLFWFPLWIERTLNAGQEGKTIATLILMSSCAVGNYFAGYLFLRFKRKPIFFMSYLTCFLIASFMYFSFHKYSPALLIFVSVLGFVEGIIPAGFAIYFPELFPTKIRSTAKGFCFSTSRIITVFGVLYSGYLVQKFSGNIGYAAASMSIIFLIGAIISLFIRETEKITCLE